MNRARIVALSLLLFFDFEAYAADAGKIPVVVVQDLKRVIIYDQLSYPAKLSPRIDAKILADSDGIVKRIAKHLGQLAAKNQTIVTLMQTDPGLHYVPIQVLAPVKGVVSSVDVTEGSRVTKGQALATITDPNQLKILIEVAV